MKVQINDCTIRDGGYCLGKNSPKEFVHGVVQGLVDAGIDIIEIGFLQKVTNEETIVYKNSVDAREYIPENADASRFTGFCDNSRYCIDNLDVCDNRAFQYLRISFAKHEADAALEFVKKAKEKGYKVFANPMDALCYSFEERSEMIKKVNAIKPYAFSIVDTFGGLYLEDLEEIFNQVDNELDKSIRIGLHSHNNLQLSNALAERMIDLAIKKDRDIVVDGSLYGMGRGAGNADTEVIANYLNRKHGANYNVGVLFDTIEKYIIPCLSNPNVDKWGYNLSMLVCGTFDAHVDNVNHMKKNGITNSSDIYRVIESLDPSVRKRYGSHYSKTNFDELDKACEKLKK